eukprot:759206_1
MSNKTWRKNKIELCMLQCVIFFCICCILSVIAYFSYNSWQKYQNEIEDYCEYKEDLSYTEPCSTRENPDGRQQIYAYNTTYCGLIYKESTNCESVYTSTPTP